MLNHKTAQENKLECTSETSVLAKEVLAEPPLSVTQLVIKLNEPTNTGFSSCSTDSTLYPSYD